MCPFTGTAAVAGATLTSSAAAAATATATAALTSTMSASAALALSQAGVAAAATTTAQFGAMASMSLMSTLSLELGILGSAVSMMAHQQRMAAMNAQARRQAEIARQEAERKNLLADRERKKGIRLAVQAKSRASNLAGMQRKGFAVSGVEFSGDSPLDVLEDTAGFGALDALNARHDGEMRAWQLEVGARSDLAQGGAYLSKQQSPIAESASTLVSTLGGVAEKIDHFANDSGVS